MPAVTPGDPRALRCHHCGSRRRYVRATLVCPTCDESPRWPGGTLDRPPPAPLEEDGDASADPSPR